MEGFFTGTAVRTTAHSIFFESSTTGCRCLVPYNARVSAGAADRSLGVLWFVADDLDDNPPFHSEAMDDNRRRGSLLFCGSMDARVRQLFCACLFCFLFNPN